eukprot:GFKZ01008894.1.p1 GENE.GFKZ01008894.1~~GFKZ01008894.1.p1  ORF type:complete len:264 (+),score=40.69 GFKZ01008894.1:117-908(+)
MMLNRAMRSASNTSSLLWRGLGMQTGGMVGTVRGVGQRLEGVGIDMSGCGVRGGLGEMRMMREGKLVGDEFVLGLAKGRLAQRDCVEKGWVLDGVPRTRVQAQRLVEIGGVMRPDVVVHLKGDAEEIVRRIRERRMDPVSGRIYNLTTNMPKEQEVLQRLVRRADDEEGGVRERMRVYNQQLPGLWDVIEGSGVRIVELETAGRGIAEVVKQASDAVDGFKRVVMFGLPGCGKGTVGALVGGRRVHVSSGDLLRSRTTCAIEN